MDDVYYRATIKSAAGITGHFRYKDVFQIQSSSKSDSSFNHYIDIEFNDKYRLNDGTEERKNFLGQGYGHLDFLKELIAILHICSNYPCSLDKDESCVTPPPQEIISGFTEHPPLFPGFTSPREFSGSSTVRRDNVRILNRMNFGQSSLELQSQTELFLDKYFSLDARTRKRFNASMFLMQNSHEIKLINQSMGIVGLISAIENLMELEVKKNKIKIEKCEKCSQPIYGLAERFRNFLATYSEANFVKKYNIGEYFHREDEFKDNEPEELIASFYRRRSKITHAGDILIMDRTLSTFSASELRYFNEIETAVRIALFSYLLNFSRDAGHE